MSYINVRDIDLAEVAAQDEKLAAILICLFTDAKAEAEELPEYIKDNRGYWGDLIEINVGSRISKISLGSKIWTLAREKVTSTTEQRLKRFARDALSPLIDVGVIEEPNISTKIVNNNIVLKLQFKDDTIEFGGF